MTNRIPNALNDFADKETTAVWSQELVDFLTVETWHEVGSSGNPAFENSWANRAGEAVAAFYKSPFDEVKIKGAVDAGTNATTAFTLPTGYRPPEKLRFVSVLIDVPTSTSMITINTDGTIVPSTGNTNGIEINISFRV